MSNNEVAVQRMCKLPEVKLYLRPFWSVSSKPNPSEEAWGRGVEMGLFSPGPGDQSLSLVACAAPSVDLKGPHQMLSEPLLSPCTTSLWACEKPSCSLELSSAILFQKSSWTKQHLVIFRLITF